MRNLRTATLFFREQLDVPNLPPRAVARAHANHTRYALHAGLGRQSLRDSPSKMLWALTLPLAAAAYVRDRLANLRVAMFLEIGTVLGAITGAYVAGILHPRWLFVLFGVILGSSAELDGPPILSAFITIVRNLKIRKSFPYRPARSPR